MFEVAYITVLSVIAFIAPIVGIMLVLLAMQFTKGRKSGFMSLVPYAILLVAIADTLFSGRSLDNASLILSGNEARSSASTWLVRASSIVILMASLERIFTNIVQKGSVWGKQPALTLSFISFWVGSVGITMVLSAHPNFSHDYIYSLVIGVAVLSLNKNDSQSFIVAMRNSLFVVTALGFLMIPINSHMVLDANYSQGFIPGLPRFSGLLPHAIMQGLVALSMMLILYVYPFKNKLFNGFVWALGILALFLAQSKTSWISALLSFAVLIGLKYLYSDDPDNNSKTRKTFVVIGALVVVSLFAGLIFIFGDISQRVDRFLFSSQGQQIASLTGRDVIWQFAFDEWARNPILGYGTQFLNLEQRISIGMLNATHAHNQFIDTLARSGLIGLIALVIYLLAIVLALIKMTRENKPLAIAIFLVLFLGSISEVPFALYGYGVEFLVQLVLFSIILNSQPDKQKQSLQQSSMGFRSSL